MNTVKLLYFTCQVGMQNVDNSFTTFKSRSLLPKNKPLIFIFTNVWHFVKDTQVQVYNIQQKHLLKILLNTINQLYSNS